MLLSDAIEHFFFQRFSRTTLVVQPSYSINYQRLIRYLVKWRLKLNYF